MLTKTKGILTNQKGQGLAEYGLIIALIAVVCIGAMTLLGPAISEKFTAVGNEIKKASPGGGDGGF